MVNISWVEIKNYFFTKVIEINGKRNGHKKAPFMELKYQLIDKDLDRLIVCVK